MVLKDTQLLNKLLRFTLQLGGTLARKWHHLMVDEMSMSL